MPLITPIGLMQHPYSVAIGRIFPTDAAWKPKNVSLGETGGIGRAQDREGEGRKKERKNRKGESSLHGDQHKNRCIKERAPFS